MPYGKVTEANVGWQGTVGHGSEWLPGATHRKNDPPYHSSKFWYIGGILAKEARFYLKLASKTEQIYLEGW